MFPEPMLILFILNLGTVSKHFSNTTKLMLNFVVITLARQVRS